MDPHTGNAVLSLPASYINYYEYSRRAYNICHMILIGLASKRQLGELFSTKFYNDGYWSRTFGMAFARPLRSKTSSVTLLITSIGEWMGGLGAGKTDGERARPGCSRITE